MKVTKIDLRDECTVLEKGDIIDCISFFTIILSKGKGNLSFDKRSDLLAFGYWHNGQLTHKIMERLYRWESGE